jgi:hypothetical protein
MMAIVDFLNANAALLFSVVALVISLRANFTAQQTHRLNVKTKADSDRILVFEKRSEILNEVDRQHARLGTLLMLTAKKILLFKESPDLHQTMQTEFDRLKDNLISVQHLESRYEMQRRGIELQDVGADPAKQEDLLANIRSLTIRLEKEIAHEQAHLEELRLQIREQPNHSN